MTPTLSREIRELADAALRLQAATGANVVTNILHAAARRIDAEEDVIDGWSGNLRRDGMPSGGRSEDTTVERAMMARYEIRTDREDLRDCLTSVTAEIDALRKVVPLRSAWKKRGFELDLGIGIAQGYATLGAIGQVDGGADPRYMARRLIRMASEDIGLADPRALRLALDAAEV